jgi:tetratricopeptide (TPR) repeat protein
MSVLAVRVLVVAAALWLAGCESLKTIDLSQSSEGLADGSGEPATTASVPTTTGSVTAAPIGAVLVSQPAPPGAAGTAEPTAQAGLMGTDPNDDLSLGKKYFRAQDFGLAERHFRRAVEAQPKDAEAWLGLAATYDRLKRFDLADRAYDEAVKLVGQTPEILNNHGFSYLLRGDHRRARSLLLAAQARDPGNPYIQNNLALLEKSARKRKGVD